VLPGASLDPHFVIVEIKTDFTGSLIGLNVPPRARRSKRSNLKFDTV
jgi:hypothetical protein